jgi:cell division protein FtsW (lipid II flippase)
VLWNGVRIAGLARDRFGTFLALGVTVLFAVHVFVNIAMTIGLMPITGIPLPFISYGGSFVLSCCLLQGLVQSVYRFRGTSNMSLLPRHPTALPESPARSLPPTGAPTQQPRTTPP